MKIFRPPTLAIMLSAMEIAGNLPTKKDANKSKHRNARIKRAKARAQRKRAKRQHRRI